jgi:hypothetical protein
VLVPYSVAMAIQDLNEISCLGVSTEAALMVYKNYFHL